MIDFSEFKNIPEEEAVNIIKNGIGADLSGLKNMLKNHDSVAKDVCEYYGISREQYIQNIMGIGDTSILKHNGIEFDET